LDLRGEEGSVACRKRSALIDPGERLVPDRSTETSLSANSQKARTPDTRDEWLSAFALNVCFDRTRRANCRAGDSRQRAEITNVAARESGV
jgi:hypothetical protein